MVHGETGIYLQASGKTIYHLQWAILSDETFFLYGIFTTMVKLPVRSFFPHQIRLSMERHEQLNFYAPPYGEQCLFFWS